MYTWPYWKFRPPKVPNSLLRPPKVHILHFVPPPDFCHATPMVVNAPNVSRFFATDAIRNVQLKLQIFEWILSEAASWATYWSRHWLCVFSRSWSQKITEKKNWHWPLDTVGCRHTGSSRCVPGSSRLTSSAAPQQRTPSTSCCIVGRWLRLKTD